jgi:dynein heavy chain
MLIRITEDVKVDLDDHLLNLQTVAGSRFIKSLITRVKLWETNLNRI